MGIETIKTIIRIISIICGILIYLFIWYRYIKDREIRRTIYCSWCFEKFLNGFYFIWDTIHILALILILFLAWR
jgi:hypothetical protein